MLGPESLLLKALETPKILLQNGLKEIQETAGVMEIGENGVVEIPDISFIENTSRSALLEQ